MPYHTQAQLTLLYAEYKNNGILGYEGGILDQPEVYWDDMAWMRALELWVEHIAPLTMFHTVHNHEPIIEKLRRGGVM